MLKWEYVNMTCPGCGKKLRVVARLRNGQLLLQCQDTEKIKGLKSASRCSRRLKQFAVWQGKLVVDDSPDMAPGAQIGQDELVWD